MKEKDVQHSLIMHMLDRGWKVFRMPPPSTVGARAQMKRIGSSGWPDVVAVRDDRMVAVECKGSRGRVSPEQTEWLSALEEVAYCNAFVCEPSNLDDVRKELL